METGLYHKTEMREKWGRGELGTDLAADYTDFTDSIRVIRVIRGYFPVSHDVRNRSASAEALASGSS